MCFTSLIIQNASVQRQRYYSPVGNCDEANLVSKIPAPSINASRTPPMAAEPTMATGPSKDEQEVVIYLTCVCTHSHNHKRAHKVHSALVTTYGVIVFISTQLPFKMFVFFKSQLTANSWANCTKCVHTA